MNWYQKSSISPNAVVFFPKLLHLVNCFLEQFFVWNRFWLCTTDKSYCSRWYNSYQAFQYNMMLLAWIKGTFNGEESHRQKSSVQSIIYRITGYYRLSVSDMLLSNLTFGILLFCQIGILRNERYIKFIHVEKYRNTVDLSVSNITYEYRFVYSLLSVASVSCNMRWRQTNSGKVY